MIIEAVDTKPYPVWMSQYPDGASQYYRAVLPARMTGGVVQSELLMGIEGQRPAPVKVFEIGALDEFQGHERITVSGLGSPTIIAWRDFGNLNLEGNPTLIPFVRALMASGADVRIETDDYLLCTERALIVAMNACRSTVIDAMVRVCSLEAATRIYDEEGPEMWRKAAKAPLQKHRAHYLGAIEQAKNLIVATETLGYIMEVHRPTARIQVAPNCVDISDFKPQERASKEKIWIGYTGDPSHSADAKLALPGLLRLAQNLPGQVELHFWGWHPRVFDYGASGIAAGNYEFEGARYFYHGHALPITQFQREIRLLDVAVAPLENNTFNHCKSAQKWFEASLNGTAMVLQKLTPYEDIVEHGVTGMLANDADEFYEHLRSLCFDHGLRRRMGEAARAAVLKNHTIDACREQWQRAVA